jgi:hypothetical protein
MVMHGPDHALRQQFKVGMKVYFGRKRGEQTLGEIVKMNPRKAKVKQLEDRGAIRDYPIGTVWTVPFTLMKPADPKASFDATVPAQPVVKREALTYNPFAGEDNYILSAIVSVYSGLSPENLHADGERPITQVRRLKAELDRKLKHLQLALGRDVDEVEAYEWSRSRDQWHRDRQKAQ